MRAAFSEQIFNGTALCAPLNAFGSPPNTAQVRLFPAFAIPLIRTMRCFSGAVQDRAD